MSRPHASGKDDTIHPGQTASAGPRTKQGDPDGIPESVAESFPSPIRNDLSTPPTHGYSLLFWKLMHPAGRFI
jgi:hypothetical protein